MQADLQSETKRRPQTTTLSSRNQVTVPASLVRRFGIGPGTRFFVEDFGDVIVLVPDLADDGLPTGCFGTTPEEVARYIANERASWSD